MFAADLTVVRTCICSWMGKGVSTAVQNANDIIGPALIVSALRCNIVMIGSLLIETQQHQMCSNLCFTVAVSQLQGMDPTKQKDIDNKMIELDGTDNKVHATACHLTRTCLHVVIPCRLVTGPAQHT